MFKNHPPGLKVLFFTEMWERFGYYLMLGIFVLYMIDPASGGPFGGLGFSQARAAEIYGSFIALVYLTPFVGGILADRYLGYRKSVLLGGLLMACGYLGIGLFPGLAGFYLALGLIVLGNGFFKPSMSTIVGRLYPEGSKLKDAGYNIFYMGINIGAFVCNFVAAFFRNQFGWAYAFGAAGVGMFFGLAIFLLGRRQIAQAGDRGDGSAAGPGALSKLALSVFLPAAAAGIAGFWISKALNLAASYPFLTPGNSFFAFAVVPVIVYYLALLARAPEREKGPIAAILAMSGVVVVFWMIFHQNGSTLTLWTEKNTRREAGRLAGFLEAVYMNEDATIGRAILDPDSPASYWHNVPPEERPPAGEKATLISTELFQSVNPFFVVVLTPLVVGFFSWLRRRGAEPSTPAKIAWGMLVTTLSMLIMIAGVRQAEGGLVKASPWWVVGVYGVITVGELFLSPMGLSMVSKLSPKRVTALMMGCWFLATSIGNKLAGVLAGFIETMPFEKIFWINCLSALAAAAAMAALVPWIRRAMAEHERAEVVRAEVAAEEPA